MPAVTEPTIWKRHAGAACRPLHGYRRHEPEKTLLHAVVREQLETLLAEARERTSYGLPAFVERELRGYLDCGLLSRGFTRSRCRDCGFERLVAFSCKASICPSCAARRMEDGADHLVRNVIPQVPVRQWVLSFPRRVRFLTARYPALVSRLLAVFTRTVFAWQRQVARRQGAAEPRTAGVTAVQRAGGAVNLNVHFHTLVPDGVFELDGAGPARFVPLPSPRDEEVEAILRRIVRRVAKALAGCDEEAGTEADALAAQQAAEVDRRLRYPDPFPHQRCSASVDGFSLHAGVRIHENDRGGLERLCRYVLRPPFALQRLSWGEDGRLVYRMKRPRGGSLFLVLTPQELVARMATLVPPPRVHGVRYHGLFAPHAKERSRVVAAAAPQAVANEPPPSPRTATRTSRTYRVPWVPLLKKVFALDILHCPGCGGTMQVLAVIADTAIARRILGHLGLDSTGPQITARAQGPPDLCDPGPVYDVADPVYPD